MASHTGRVRHHLRAAAAGLVLATCLSAHAEPLLPPNPDALHQLVASLLKTNSSDTAQAVINEGIAREAVARAAAREPAAKVAAPSLVPDVRSAAPTPEPKKTFLGQFQDFGHQVSDTASDLVFTSLGFIGVPYLWGGNSESTGFDCSGFVKAVFERTAGLVLPRLAKDQASAGKSVEKHDLQPGDLVFFNTMRRAFSHVGIYIGEGKFVHAPRTGEQVRVEDMQKSYWKTRFNGARRIVAANGEALSPEPKQPRQYKTASRQPTTRHR